MKTKRIVMLLMSVLAVTTLGACRGRGRGRGSSETPASSDASSGGSNSHLIPTPSGSGNNSNSSSQQGGSSNTAISGKTMADVAADINASLGQDILAQKTSSGATYFNGGIDLSEDGEDYSNTAAPQSLLQPAVEFVAGYMPTYLSLVGSYYWTGEDDYWEDESGDTVYQTVYQTGDGGVEVEIIGYCYDDALLSQISVYVPSAS